MPHTLGERNDTFDRSLCGCQKYLCVTSGRSNKTRASLSRRQKCSKKVIYLHPYTAGKPNISDSCFCVYCTRTAIVFSRKGAYESFFFGIFYVNCNKTRTGNTAYRQSNNPYCYQHHTPRKIGFFRPDISGILSIVPNIHFVV